VKDAENKALRLPNLLLPAIFVQLLLLLLLLGVEAA
jgi:hypothetical protein